LFVLGKGVKYGARGVKNLAQSENLTRFTGKIGEIIRDYTPIVSFANRA